MSLAPIHFDRLLPKELVSGGFVLHPDRVDAVLTQPEERPAVRINERYMELYQDDYKIDIVFKFKGQQALDAMLYLQSLQT